MSGRDSMLSPGARGAGYIVHEVNQPLAAILINAHAALRWMTREPPNLDMAKQAIECVIGDSHRAANIITSVGYLIQKTHPAATALDINDVIKETLDIVSRGLQRDNVELEIKFAKDLRPIMGDRVQLGRLFDNLIANAIEAMCAVTDRKRRLRISTQLNENGDVLVAIEDTGTGIDPAKIGRIFDPFFTTKREGLGLGLSICRSIAIAHSGRLSVSANLPYGSIFRVTIPACSG